MTRDTRTVAAKTHDPEWFHDQEQVLAFARVLHDSGAFDVGDVVDEGAPVRNVLYYFEKPWKWTAEHAHWCALGRPAAIDLAAVQHG